MGEFTGAADFSALAITNGVLYIGANTGGPGAVLAFDRGRINWLLGHTHSV